MESRKKDKIPGWLIILGFCFSVWPGLVLLGIRLFQDANEKENGAAKRSDSEWARNAQDVAYRTTNGQRTYQPPTGAKSGGVESDGTYHYQYQYQSGGKTASQTGNAPRPGAPGGAQSRPRPQMNILNSRKLSASTGKGLRISGNIILGSGVFISALVLLAAFTAGFFNAMWASSITALCIAAPGAVLSIIGSKRHNRVMRCRTYATMIGQQRSVSIDQLAAAIPTGYGKCCEDINWMLGEGLLSGMYIDAGSRTLTYPGAAPVQEEAQEPAPPRPQPRAETQPDGTKAYPEELRIRKLNDEIQDEYVSRRMSRLEELTHKILAYAEAHPEKEASLRQFRNHYLPKTIGILESYARMERQGVNGGNIGAAMKDVEDIMDKLVSGFEKQLDALFDSEAMDVTTDISVLESMMNLEGLSDLDPFGTLKKDDDLLNR